MAKCEIEIREMRIEDQDFITEMLYQAIHVKEGDMQPSRSVLEEPKLKNTMPILERVLMLDILHMIKNRKRNWSSMVTVIFD